MHKLMSVVYRKAELTHEQFVAEWSGKQHHSISQKIPYVKKWVLNYGPPPNEDAPDGIGEGWFESAEMMEKALNSPEWAAAVEDSARFLDMDKTYALFVNETPL